MKVIQEAGLFLIFVIVISFLFNYFVSTELFYPDKIVKGIQIYVDKIQYLYKQSKQDTDQIFALNHVSSAYSLANSIKYIMADDFIRRYYNIDINSLIYEIKQHQTKIINLIRKNCPNLS
jgi:hypothetical protein